MQRQRLTDKNKLKPLANRPDMGTISEGINVKKGGDV
jgi:hypothetical protein